MMFYQQAANERKCPGKIQGKCFNYFGTFSKMVDNANPVTKFTDNTITDKSALKAELKQIREQGFAIDNMEHEYGVKCVSVPIFKADNTLAGAMSITCPSLRMEGKYAEFAKLLHDAQKNLRPYL